MASKYLNIKDFAKIAGVSKQSLYKRLSNPNNDIQKYVSMVNNHVAISIDALDSLYFNSSKDKALRTVAEMTDIPSEGHEALADRHHVNNVLSSIMDVVDVLKEQLKQKDNQIEALQKNLSDCLTMMSKAKEHEL